MKPLPPVLMLLGLLLGCRSESAPPATPAPATSQAKPQAPEPAKPDPGAEFDKALAAAETEFEAGQLDQADIALDKLRLAGDELTDEQLDRLDALEQQVQDQRAEMEDQARAAQLAEARKLLEAGQLDESRQLLNTLLAAGPNQEQRSEANQLKTSIEDRWKARRKLATAMRLLASTSRSEVRAAQEQLWDDAESAIPLLQEAVRGPNPALAANALEMLRLFNRPETSLAAIVGVLANVAQEPIWPAAIREVQKFNHPGLGEPLLKLALTSQEPKQRIAALEALSQCQDPPKQTLIALLPIVHADGPELAAALVSARQALAVHRQYDLASRRGLGLPLTSDDERLLDALPERLTALAAGAATKKPLSPEAQAAMALAVAARLKQAGPLEGVKVLRVSGEDPASPGSGAIDGVWNTATPDKMWRYPLGGQASIVLDLGAERTVSGVRIWNYNEPSAAHRGWKDVEIFVSNSPALLSPIAFGLAPPAPAVADSHDYSVTLPVPFARGRYVKLQPKTLWREDALSGLTEVQVLGF